MRAVRPRELWLTLVACAGALALLLLPFTCFSPHALPQFRDVVELRTWAEGHGLHCRSDRKDGKVGGGLAVSTRPLKWEEVVPLTKGRQVLGPAWSQIVWAVNRTPGLASMPAPPWDGECRIWGDVVATGDPALLDLIERSQGRG
jgi:hypothetical protein